MTKKMEEKLLEIAMNHNGEMRERGDFETRNSDQDDLLTLDGSLSKQPSSSRKRQIAKRQ